VNERYGWSLDLFDIERLRMHLSGDSRHLLARHPAIFCPPFFPQKGGLSVSECRDTIVIDHLSQDHAVANWLARKLQLAGYRTWCYGTAPLAGETAEQTVRELIERRSIAYLPILSPSALADADFVGRIALATSQVPLIVPCASVAYASDSLPTSARTLTPARFDTGWASGLRDVLHAIRSGGIGGALTETQGTTVALRSYVPEPVTRSIPEKVFANVFPVEVPDAILVCKLSECIPAEQCDLLRKKWSFVASSPTTLLAFEPPPRQLPLVKANRIPEYSWRDVAFQHGKKSLDVVKELVRRSLDLACIRAGLNWCDDRCMYYFPHVGTSPVRYVSYTHVDGRTARVSVTGEKSFGSGRTAKRFRYQLCPRFRIGFDDASQCWATLRIYVRITMPSGELHHGKGILRRRKKVTRAWWNKEWFARTIAIMQSLSGDEDAIRIGSGRFAVLVSTQPMDWECPVSIDVEAVDRIGDFQEEMVKLSRMDFEQEYA